MLTHVLGEQREKAARERGLSKKATPSKDNTGEETEEEDLDEELGRKRRRRRSKTSECVVTKRLVTLYMLQTCAGIVFGMYDTYNLCLCTCVCVTHDAGSRSSFQG